MELSVSHGRNNLHWTKAVTGSTKGSRHAAALSSSWVLPGWSSPPSSSVLPRADKYLGVTRPASLSVLSNAARLSGVGPANPRSSLCIYRGFYRAPPAVYRAHSRQNKYSACTLMLRPVAKMIVIHSYT